MNKLLNFRSNVNSLLLGKSVRGMICSVLAVATSILAVSSSAAGKEGPTNKDYDWWRKARFGIFIHWNPSSLLALGGGSWQRQTKSKKESTNATTPGQLPDEMKKPGWEKKYYAVYGTRVPMDVYDNLYQVFNPAKFNAEEWVKTFKEAGAKYVVIITKHHDGFCMWDSAYTDYKITNTPFKRDTLKELTDACHKNGIEVILYYSKPDWYDTRYSAKNPKPYEDYMANQIKELCTKYGKIRGFWWDGGKNVHVDGERIADIILTNQPGAIYNGRGGMNTPGLKFGTSEQKLGVFNRNSPWESCITMQGEGWFWNGGKNMMSLNDCIKLLAAAATGDGNLLLDFGPTELGTIPEAVRKNYLGMGAWLKKYGESIYGTRGGPYKPGLWGGSTCKGNTVYLHITEVWPSGKLVLPALPAKIVKTSALTGGTPKITEKEGNWVITMPQKDHAVPDTILKIELDKDAVAIEAPIPSEKVKFVSLNASATASSQKQGRGMAGSVTVHTCELNMGKAKYFGEDDTIEGAPATIRRYKPSPDDLKKYPWLTKSRGHIWRYWMAGANDKQPWIMLDMGKVKKFNVISILEKFNRTKKFKIQYEDNGTWQDLYEGNELGSLDLALPKTISAQKVKIQILDWASDDPKSGPGIRMFDLWLSELND